MRAITETEFRVQHSTLIEYYQYIEMRLKGICSAIHQDRLIEWYMHLFYTISLYLSAELHDHNNLPAMKKITKLHGGETH